MLTPSSAVSFQNFCSSSVLLGEHDRDDPLGYRRIGWIGGMMGEGPIIISASRSADRYPNDLLDSEEIHGLDFAWTYQLGP